MLCHKSASDESALVIKCGRDEKLWLSVAACWKIVMACTHCRAIDTDCPSLKLWATEHLNMKAKCGS
jgi:hypothetical protein